MKNNKIVEGICYWVVIVEALGMLIFSIKNTFVINHLINHALISTQRTILGIIYHAGSIISVFVGQIVIAILIVWITMVLMELIYRKIYKTSLFFE